MRRGQVVRSLLAMGVSFGLALGLAACGASVPNGSNNGGENSTPDMATAPADMAKAQFDYAITLKSFDLQPGEEKIFCQYVPADGTERFVSRFVTDMSPGSHHLVVFRVDETQGRPATTDLVSCSQLEIPTGFDGMLPGSQERHTDFTLPQGVAFKLSPTHGLYFQMHYINATAQAISAHVTWSLGTVDKTHFQQEAGMLFYSNFGLNIPPGMSVATRSCKAPADLYMATATGHMHKHGLTFDATVAGKSVFHTDNWDEPKASIFPVPGEAVKMGDPISWACAYNNDTAAALHFGNSALTDEMCIFAALYYPATVNGTEFNCAK